jgi:hypothetical protein
MMSCGGPAFLYGSAGLRNLSRELLYTALTRQTRRIILSRGAAGRPHRGIVKSCGWRVLHDHAATLS